jgi:hypothetical protein
MKWIGIVAAAVIGLAIPAMAFAQAPMGAWCGGSYGAEGTNFAPCPEVQAGAQVAGQASGVQAQTVATTPLYPATEVTFEGGKAHFNKQQLNLNFKPSAVRLDEAQAPGD